MTSSLLVVGNWKMNGSAARLSSFADVAARNWPLCEAVLCVPHTLLPVAQAAFRGTPLRWGAQDCSAQDEGAYTGEVSARMLRELGARYVIVGHSERRIRHGETDEVVAGKAGRALAAGITPIVCVGENAEERDGELTAAVLRRQLLPLARTLGRDIGAIVIAYEPVLAIGSGDAATPGTIEHTHELIAHTLSFHAGIPMGASRVLYGGSVNPCNASAILSRRWVSGVLVGGASLASADFIEICNAASGGSASATTRVAA
jgi:triosephosphate isomerase